MPKEFQQISWDVALAAQWSRLLELAYEEDLGPRGDLTSQTLVPEHISGRAAIVARRPGVAAGLAAVPATLQRFDPALAWHGESEDGQTIRPGQRLGVIEGPARAMLSAERTVLNLLGRLSGIASLARTYVEAVAGTKARIYDTRKTTPGWRRLEKYAVRCGGGWNHRTGLFEAVLIKDNHLAFHAQQHDRKGVRYSPAEAVRQARGYLENLPEGMGRGAIVEIEVDTLDQLDDVLPSTPDLVLLDNMPPAMLREAVARRDACGSSAELEASGGVDLGTVRQIAASGVDRISVGALTHSAPSLDIGLDWL